MITGKWFISTGFRESGTGWWHFLLAVHRKWRFDFVRPSGKPGYRRLYVGPLEFEWSRP
jgi:hypothetical protein